MKAHNKITIVVGRKARPGLKKDRARRSLLNHFCNSARVCTQIAQLGIAGRVKWVEIYEA